MIRLLPVRVQACFWVFYHKWRDGWSSHWRINAYRSLRRSAKIPLKEAATEIDRVRPRATNPASPTVEGDET